MGDGPRGVGVGWRANSHLFSIDVPQLQGFPLTKTSFGCCLYLAFTFIGIEHFWLPFWTERWMCASLYLSICAILSHHQMFSFSGQSSIPLRLRDISCTISTFQQDWRSKLKLGNFLWIRFLRHAVCYADRPECAGPARSSEGHLQQHLRGVCSKEPPPKPPTSDHLSTFWVQSQQICQVSQLFWQLDLSTGYLLQPTNDKNKMLHQNPNCEKNNDPNKNGDLFITNAMKTQTFEKRSMTQKKVTCDYKKKEYHHKTDMKMNSSSPFITCFRQ